VNNYLIIQDKSASVRRIKSVFNKYANFNFVSSYNTYNQSINAILKHLPDLIFIDIDDPNIDSFSLVKEIKNSTNKLPLIIALSSTKNLAYDVIKMNFLDYLLKPLTEVDLRKTMLKTQKLFSSQSISTVCLRSYKDYQYLNTEEILFLKADNNATDFYMKDGTVISAFKTLKTYQDALPNNFLRIHKSYIINSYHVSRINYGKYMCTLNKPSFNIPFTKTYLNNVEAINSTLSQSSLRAVN